METLLTLLGGALAAGAVYGLNLLRAQIFVGHYGAVINRVFTVIDPIAGQLIERYEGSLVQEAIVLAVHRVADGELDEKDALAVAKFVAEKFDLTKAAAHRLDPSSEEGKASLEVAGMVKDLFDGADKDELIALAKKAASLL